MVLSKTRIQRRWMHGDISFASFHRFPFLCFLFSPVKKAAGERERWSEMERGEAASVRERK